MKPHPADRAFEQHVLGSGFCTESDRAMFRAGWDARERQIGKGIPTLEEVRAYCAERRNGVDAERFVDFYLVNGWKRGKEPIKDWKACVRTWERRDSYQAPPRVSTASLGAVQMELQRIEGQIREILHPGGAAFAVTPTDPNQIEELDGLRARRKELQLMVGR